MTAMRTLLRLALLAAAFGLGTAVLGWWAVPLAGAVWGVVARDTPGAALASTLGAVLAWGALLALAATRGPVLELADKLGRVMGAPGVALLVLTLAFAAVLAWSATTVAAVLAALAAGPTRERARPAG